MRAVWVTLALVATGLAGCADGGNPPPPEEQVFEDLGGDATATTGLIRGVVVDAAIVPLEGVNVTVRGTDRSVTTNQHGAFVIDELEPGTYFLEASKPGFGKVQKDAVVEAGVDKPAIIRIQLVALPSEAPLIVPLVFDGFIQCSWVAVAAALAMCSVPETAGVDLGDEFLQRMEVNGYPDFTQGELQWQSTQALGEALAFSVWDGSTSAPRRTEGPSPRFIMADRDFWENATGADKGYNQPGGPMVTDQEEIAWRVFAGAHPDTQPPCLVICWWGVGVTVEQRFTIYTNIFYNIIPDEEWRFIYDGPYQP